MGFDWLDNMEPLDGKHFFSIIWFYPLWDCSKLHYSYRDSAYLSNDTSSLNTFFEATHRAAK